jgi:hypothetical protein
LIDREQIIHVLIQKRKTQIGQLLRRFSGFGHRKRHPKMPRFRKWLILWCREGAGSGFVLILIKLLKYQDARFVQNATNAVLEYATSTRGFRRTRTLSFLIHPKTFRSAVLQRRFSTGESWQPGQPRVLPGTRPELGRTADGLTDLARQSQAALDAGLHEPNAV